MSKYDTVNYKSFREEKVGNISNMIKNTEFSQINSNIFEKEQFLKNFKTLNLLDISELLNFSEKENRMLAMICSDESKSIELKDFKNVPIEDFIANLEQFKLKHFSGNNSSKESVNQITINSDQILDEECLNMTINYIRKVYGDIITPKTLKKIIDEFSSSPTTNLDVTEEEYKKLIYNEFRKYIINIKEEGPKFRNLLKEIMNSN